MIHKDIPLELLMDIYYYDETTGEFIRKEDQTTVGYSWKNTYINLPADNESYKGHRVAFALCMYQPGELVVDHKNSHKGDNRIVNLQAITQKENIRLGWLKRRGVAR